MVKFYRDPYNQFHVAYDEHGLYLRVGEHGTPVTVPTDVAHRLFAALGEVLEGTE